MDSGLPDIAAVAAAAERSSSTMNSNKANSGGGEDIMSVLLAHERHIEPQSSSPSHSNLGIASEVDTDVFKTEPGKKWALSMILVYL